MVAEVAPAVSARYRPQKRTSPIWNVLITTGWKEKRKGFKVGRKFPYLPIQNCRVSFVVIRLACTQNGQISWPNGTILKIGHKAYLLCLFIFAQIALLESCKINYVWCEINNHDSILRLLSLEIRQTTSFMYFKNVKRRFFKAIKSRKKGLVGFKFPIFIEKSNLTASSAFGMMR